MKKSNRRKIKNVFAGADYQCIACSPSNPIGFRLSFYEEGEFVKSEWQPTALYEGYPGTIHGGIQATLLDEIAAWTVYIKAKTSGVTSQINVKYKKPVSSQQSLITVQAQLVEMKRNLCFLKAQLLDEKGEVCTEADLVYYTFPTSKAIEMGWYPENYEDFFKE